MTTFTAAIGREIEARFGDGSHFTRSDFVNIANKFGKQDKSITHVLREMAERGGIKIAGELRNKTGGTFASKVYARVSGARLVPDPNYRKFSHKDWKRGIEETEAYRNHCGAMLHEIVVVGWDRSADKPGLNRT